MSNLALVYQSGLANVFTITAEPGSPQRILQSDYHTCETFCRGAKWGGWPIAVYHVDVAGDCSQADWNEGPGDLWREHKRPPLGAMHADLS